MFVTTYFKGNLKKIATIFYFVQKTAFPKLYLKAIY